MKPDKIRTEQLTRWRKDPVTQAVLRSLQLEKDTFITKLQNGNIQTPNFDRYVALQLGAVQGLTSVIETEKLKSLMWAHKQLHQVEDYRDE